MKNESASIQLKKVELKSTILFKSVRFFIVKFSGAIPVNSFLLIETRSHLNKKRVQSDLKKGPKCLLTIELSSMVSKLMTVT